MQIPERIEGALVARLDPSSPSARQGLQEGDVILGALTLVDLTLIGGDGQELDMGTPFDTFSSAAHTANATGEVASNRRLLVLLMQAEGFTNYEKEWWHFTYDVPNPLRFDLVIR